MTRPDPLAEPVLSQRHADALALAKREPRQLDMFQRLVGCPPPVWLNRDERKLPDGKCVMIIGSRCGRPAPFVVWIGCTTGEHLDHSHMCEAHMTQVASWKALHCQRCWDALGIVSDAKVIKVEPVGS